MTRQDAHDMLDAARDGAEFTQTEIDSALMATGDLKRDERQPRPWVDAYLESRNECAEVIA